MLEPPPQDVDALVSLFHAGRLAETESLANALVAKFPGALILYRLRGTAQLGQRKFKEAEATCRQVLRLAPDLAEGHNNLAAALHGQGKLEEAVASYREAVAVKPDFAAAYNTLGSILRDLGRPEEAAASYRQAVALMPTAAAAHSNLAAALHDLGQLDEAAASCRRALELNPNDTVAHYNFANVLWSQRKPGEAADHYKKTGTPKAAAQVLECFYASGDRNAYARELSELSRNDPTNIRAAAISAFAAHQWGTENTHPFCRDPFPFISVQNMRGQLEPFETFIAELTAEAERAKPVWQPPGKTTKNGFQTHGDLFRHETPALVKLQAMIRSQVEVYRARFAGAADAFMSSWPAKFAVYGWHVRLLKAGYQEAHIHPGGWLSGVFYMRMPKAVSGDEGAIKFGLRGYDYPVSRPDLPSAVHRPQDGDLVMFPSSLFHQTVPFSADEERLIIAFDVQPED